MKWRILLVVLLTAGAIYYVYPPQEKINLGLDLRGGIHMVLKVNLDEALRAELDNTKSNLEYMLQDEKIEYTNITKDDKNLKIIVEGIPADKIEKAKEKFKGYMAGYTMKELGNGTFEFTMKESLKKEIKKQAMKQALLIINNRVDEYGVAEPVIQRQGLESDRIVIELPGVDNPERIKKSLSEPGWLELRLLADPNPYPSKEMVLQAHNGKLPKGTTILPGEDGKSFYLVKERVELNGNDIKTARRATDRYGSPSVSFSLNKVGVEKFAKVTGEHVGERLAIILDKKIVSAPRINEQINSPNAEITGRFSIEEAEDLAIKLRSGALPASMTFLEERTVGPSLGRDSIRKGIKAAIWGLIIVMLFMLFYYKLAGLNADIALLLNMIYLLGGMAYFHATLTLPGIAGFILTIGMAVDANVIIFERIKEELRNGKTPRAAVDTGFSKGLSAVLDGNITTLIAALFLFQYGTGPVKGFAVTLSLGIIASLFTAIFVSKLIFDIVLSIRSDAETLSI